MKDKRKDSRQLRAGQIIGMNKIVRMLDERYISPQGKKHIQWELECTRCGKRGKISTTCNINSGRVDSCRCVSCTPEIVSKRASGNIKHGSGAIEVYGDYRRSAKKRGIEFNLTLTDATKMFKSDCYYCGDPPTMTKTRKTGDFLYNGIDRIDDQKIYTTNNTVACCKTCNRIKHIRPEKEFIQHIKKIIKHHG